MKVNFPITIRLSEKHSAAKFLKGLKAGAEVPVKIVERLGRHDAILDIRGNRIRADFFKGVPGNDRLLLKFEGVKENSFIFKIVDTTSRAGFIDKIIEFSVFGQNDLEKNTLFNLNNYLAKNITSIFDLNVYLLKKEFKNNKFDLARLLNLLMKNAGSKEAVSDFSNFLSILKTGSHGLAEFIQVILEKDSQRKKGFPGKGFVENLEKIVNQIDILMDSDEKYDIIRYLLGLLLDRGERKGYVLEEIYYLDNDEYKPLRFLGKEDSWIFFLELSGLGKIDILLKKFKDGVNISIFVEDNIASDALNDSISDLKLRIGEIYKNFEIDIFNRNTVIDRIGEMSLYYSMNSDFDVKV